MSARASKRASGLLRVGLAALVVILGVAGLAYRHPYVVDALGGGVDRQCAGRMTLRGGVGDARLSERHCFTGPSTSRSVWVGKDGRAYAALRVDMETGRLGRVLLYGEDVKPGTKGALVAAWVRAPGDGERWLCSRGGELRLEEGSTRGEARLTGVSEVDATTPDPTGGSIELDLDAKPQRYASRLDGRTLSDGRSGSAGANPEYTRVDLRFDAGPASAPEQVHELWLAAEGSMRSSAPVALRSAFVLVSQDDGRPARLSVARGASTAQIADLSHGRASLLGLTRPFACPDDGKGELTIAWDR